MPDFPTPPGGGATAAQVWAYGTRALSTPNDYKADVTNLDAAITTRAPSGEYDTELDVVVSSRAPASEYDAEMANLDVAVSSRSSHDAASIWAAGSRELSTPASYKADVTRLDNIPAYETPVEASIVMTGSEVTLVEKTDDKIGILDGYVDLTPMEAGDTIVIRQSMQVKAAGAYVQYAEETYSDVQGLKLLHIITKTAKDKIKVSAEQTAGTNRTLDVQFYRRVQA